MEEVAIEIKDLHVSYRITKRFSLKQQLFKKKKKALKFEALKGVSFAVPKGKIIGIIGKNGSGKSTLLRTIAGIFSPDSGTIDLKNQTVSLLSIGVGFQVNMTGRENIILSGMLLGFSEQEMLNKMDEIIAFSELGDFIDMPVRTYSSGMHSKLAFAITSSIETDIILIDEVLSVGDAKFKKKSYSKMKNLISDKTKTVVIVSHSSGTLLELCDTLLWINEGKVIMQGEPHSVMEQYLEFMEIDNKKGS